MGRVAIDRRTGCQALGIAIALSLSGCGGKVEQEAPRAGASETEPDTGTAPQKDESAAEDDAPPPNGSSSPDGTSLGSCEEGFLQEEHPHEPCNWLALDRCYDEKLDACACICPRQGDSTCLSGFYGGEGSATRVSCF